MRRIQRAALAAAFVAGVAMPASAQVSATFVLRSGETVKGSLVDMNARGIVATVGGSERAWPVSQVAVIDFVSGGKNLPADEVNKVSGGRHVLALRNGSTLVGELTDVGGKSPLRITFSSSGGNRDYSSNEVARVYFAKPAGGGTQTEAARPEISSKVTMTPPGRVQVPANGGWVNSGISVIKGQIVQLTTTGMVQLSKDPEDLANPAGSEKGRYDAGAPLPSALAGALVGRIGGYKPFGIGNQRSFPAPETGVLYLAVNDNPVNDNAGAFGVTLSTMAPPRR
jgi:hypothetical protein